MGTASARPQIDRAAQPAWRRLARRLLLWHEGGSARFWELDAARGVAILLMVAFHLVYDLVMFGFLPPEPFDGKWRPASSVIVVQFVTYSGVALSLVHQRGRKRRSAAEMRSRYLSRGLKLTGWGLVITAATWIYFGQPVVVFGILQLIGIATIVAGLFLDWGYRALLPGLVLTVGGAYLTTVTPANPALAWLGVGEPPAFQVDFFPILPWIGVMILGTVVGRWLYPQGEARFHLPDWSRRPLLRPLIWLGAHSLPVYLGHQPILLAIIVPAYYLTM